MTTAFKYGIFRDTLGRCGHFMFKSQNLEAGQVSINKGMDRNVTIRAHDGNYSTIKRGKLLRFVT